MLLIPLVMGGFLIVSLFAFASTHKVTAVGKFTIDARINLKNWIILKN